MSTIRRLYLYSVAFISLVVITWGLIGLARSAFSTDEVGDDVARLAGALALIFVGIPVFLLHWWLAQKSASRDEEERFSYIRAIFLYGALLVTLIPIVQNLMALVNRVFFAFFALSSDRLMFGFEQTWSDNLIAMVMNGLIAAYVFSVLQKDWAAEPIDNAYPEIRRLYRYFWMLYGLALMIGGVQQTLLFVFDSIGDAAITSQGILANGLTLILMGTPIWVVNWRIIQINNTEQAEQESLLRALVLFAISIIGLVVTLLAGGALLGILIQMILGVRFSLAALMDELRDPISIAIPFGITWAYFSNIRRKDLRATRPLPPQFSGVQQVYVYLCAFLGLGAFFIGLQELFFFIIELLVEQPIWGDIFRERLSFAITVLVIGLPLWYLNWRKVNKRATPDGDEGDQAQRSLVRKIYLYLVMFLSVMGVMISAGVLIFQLLQAVLGDPDDNFVQITFELVSLLILFSLLIWYHGQILRSDGRISDQAQAEQQAGFPILVLVSEYGLFSEMLVAALTKEAPTMPVAVHVVEQGVPDESLSDAKAVILTSSIAANPGEAIRLWLQNFGGFRFVVPTPVQGWVWVSQNNSSLQSLVQQTARMVKKLSEGQEMSPARTLSHWLIVAYIMLGIFGLGFLLIAISILIDVLT